MKTLSLLVLVVAVAACLTPAEQHTSATINATTYLSDLKITVRGVSCTGEDTDGDGYITCTYVRTETEAPVSIQCAIRASGGCKPPTIKAVQQVVQ